jgi:hypothetical protein
MRGTCHENRELFITFPLWFHWFADISAKFGFDGFQRTSSCNVGVGVLDLLHIADCPVCSLKPQVPWSSPAVSTPTGCSLLRTEQGRCSKIPAAVPTSLLDPIGIALRCSGRSPLFVPFLYVLVNNTIVLSLIPSDHMKWWHSQRVCERSSRFPHPRPTRNSWSSAFRSKQRLS